MISDPTAYNVMEFRGDNHIPKWAKEFKFIRNQEKLSETFDVKLPIVKALSPIENCSTSGLILFGPLGVGKTTAVCCCMEYLMSRGRHVFRVSLGQACSGLMDEDLGVKMMEELSMSDLLVIDPVDINWYGNFKALGVLGAILDARADEQRMTVGLIDAVSEDQVGEHGMFVISKVMSHRPNTVARIDQSDGAKFVDLLENEL